MRGSADSARLPRLELIAGPMYSGKTAELVRRVHLAEIARLNVRVFRPQVDTRSPDAAVLSRSGARTRAVVLERAHELLRYVESMTDVVAIDEASFFDDDLEAVVLRLLRDRRRVIVAGLDLDFAARPFGPLPRLLALADTVDKLTAVCMVCHSLYATRSQRLVDGQPARPESPQVLIERVSSRVEYQARCAACYVPPSPPEQPELPLPA